MKFLSCGIFKNGGEFVAIVASLNQPPYGLKSKDSFEIIWLS